MIDSSTEKSRALAALAKKFECAHSEVKMRRRTVRGGAIQHVYQCQRCGKATSNPVRKERAIELSEDGVLVPFDERLLRDYDNSYHAEVEKIIGDFDSRDEFNRAQFFERYDKYLRSPEWRAKRQQVFERAHGMCEGCATAKATQVHHLSYAHVGNEFLFELVAICDQCHERLHADEE